MDHDPLADDENVYEGLGFLDIGDHMGQTTQIALPPTPSPLAGQALLVARLPEEIRKTQDATGVEGEAHEVLRRPRLKHPQVGGEKRLRTTFFAVRSTNTETEFALRLQQAAELHQSFWALPLVAANGAKKAPPTQGVGVQSDEEQFGSGGSGSGRRRRGVGSDLGGQGLEAGKKPFPGATKRVAKMPEKLVVASNGEHGGEFSKAQDLLESLRAADGGAFAELAPLPTVAAVTESNALAASASRVTSVAAPPLPPPPPLPQLPLPAVEEPPPPLPPLSSAAPVVVVAAPAAAVAAALPPLPSPPPAAPVAVAAPAPPLVPIPKPPATSSPAPVTSSPAPATSSPASASLPPSKPVPPTPLPKPPVAPVAPTMPPVPARLPQPAAPAAAAAAAGKGGKALTLKAAHPPVNYTAEQVKFLYGQADRWIASGADTRLAIAMAPEVPSVVRVDKEDQEPKKKRGRPAATTTAAVSAAAAGTAAAAAAPAVTGQKKRGRPRKTDVDRERAELQFREEQHRRNLNDPSVAGIMRFGMLSSENMGVRAGLTFGAKLTDELLVEAARDAAVELSLEAKDLLQLVQDLAEFYDANLDDKIDLVKRGLAEGVEELRNGKKAKEGGEGGGEKEKEEEEKDGDAELENEDANGEDEWKDDSSEKKRTRRMEVGLPEEPEPEEHEDDDENTRRRPAAAPPVRAPVLAQATAPPSAVAVAIVPPPPPVASPPPPPVVVAEESSVAAKRARLVAMDYADPLQWQSHVLPPPADGRSVFAPLSRFTRAEGRHFDGSVAVQLIGPLRVMGADGLAPSLLREVTKLRTIMHPGLQALREIAVGESMEHVALVFTEEPRMHHYAAVAKFELGQIKCIGKAVAAALYHLHAVGLAHRNLCLENVIYAFDGTVRLADWFWCDSLPSDAVRLAAAPERIFMNLPTRSLQEPADVWSLGVVIASLLLGRPLITGATLQDQRWATEVLLGSPQERDWKELFDSKQYVPGETPRYSTLDSVLAKCLGAADPKNGLQFLERLLRYDPNRRTPIHRVVQAPWLVEGGVAVVRLPPFPVSKNGK